MGWLHPEYVDGSPIKFFSIKGNAHGMFLQQQPWVVPLGGVGYHRFFLWFL